MRYRENKKQDVRCKFEHNNNVRFRWTIHSNKHTKIVRLVKKNKVPLYAKSDIAKIKKMTSLKLIGWKKL